MDAPQSLALQNAIKHILRTSTPISSTAAQHSPTTLQNPDASLLNSSPEAFSQLSNSLHSILSHKLKLGIPTFQLISIVPLPQSLHTTLVREESIDCLIESANLPILFEKILEMRDFLVGEYYEDDKALCLDEDFSFYCINLLKQLDSVVFVREQRHVEERGMSANDEKHQQRDRVHNSVAQQQDQKGNDDALPQGADASSLPKKRPSKSSSTKKSSSNSDKKKKKKKRRKRIVEFGEEVTVREGKERPKKRRIKAMKPEELLDVIGNDQVESFANEQRRRMSVKVDTSNKEKQAEDQQSGTPITTGTLNAEKSETDSTSGSTFSNTPLSALPPDTSFLAQREIVQKSDNAENTASFSESEDTNKTDAPRISEPMDTSEVNEQEIEKPDLSKHETAQQESKSLTEASGSAPTGEQSRQPSKITETQVVAPIPLTAEDNRFISNTSQEIIERVTSQFESISAQEGTEEETPLMDTRPQSSLTHDDRQAEETQIEEDMPEQDVDSPSSDMSSVSDSLAAKADNSRAIDEEPSSFTLPKDGIQSSPPKTEMRPGENEEQNTEDANDSPSIQESDPSLYVPENVQESFETAKDEGIEHELTVGKESVNKEQHEDFQQRSPTVELFSQQITEVSRDIINRVSAACQLKEAEQIQESNKDDSPQAELIAKDQSPVDQTSVAPPVKEELQNHSQQHSTHLNFSTSQPSSSTSPLHSTDAKSTEVTFKHSTLAEIEMHSPPHTDKQQSSELSSNLSDSPPVALSPIKMIVPALQNGSPSQRDTIVVRSVPLSPISLPPTYELNGTDSPLSSPLSMRSKRKHFLLASKGHMECFDCTTNSTSTDIMDLTHTHGLLFSVLDDDLDTMLRSLRKNNPRKFIYKALDLSSVLTQNLSTLDPVTRIRVENFVKRVYTVQSKKFHQQNYISQHLSRLCNLETPEEVFSEASTDWHQLINLSARINDWNERLRATEKRLLKQWTLSKNIRSSTTHTGSEHTMDFASSPDAYLTESDQIMSKSVQDRDKVVDQLLHYSYSPSMVRQLMEGTSSGGVNDSATVDIDSLLNDSVNIDHRSNSGFRNESIHELNESIDEEDGQHARNHSHSSSYTTATSSPATNKSAQRSPAPAFSQHMKLLVKPQPPKFSRSALTAEQNGLCGGCGKNLREHYGVFRKPRLCYYTKKLYCRSCHGNDKMIIPARVLHAWDFTKKHVCKAAFEYLQEIHRTACLCVSAINPSLFEQVPNLKKARKIRLLLMKQWDLIKECPQQVAVTRKLQLDYRTFHYVKDTEMYSLDNLENLNRPMRSSPFLRQLASIFHRFNSHIVDQCEYCGSKAKEICSGCKNSHPIYRFQLRGTAVCPKCDRLFHSKCMKLHILRHGGSC
eukprot:CAMPEP_0117447058 /NCGR_PEP_ID=MMETSP0759-20121206/6670_1 /TAXON_ID=63605 /ORGANISM="Percolomonas cosmopolitus, Strain WS" /LENGTH=1366 /DNA_ID=CAMNT_0005239363 /DNA_START=115 /DNA_END=4215 /DNA_ORIENTATION=+